MDSTTVDYLLIKCFPGLEWASVSADPKFNLLKDAVRSLEDLEAVMFYGGGIVACEDRLLTPLKFE